MVIENRPGAAATSPGTTSPLPTRRLHAAAGGERGRHQPGALQEVRSRASIRSGNTTRSRTSPPRRRAGRRQQRAGRDRRRADRLFAQDLAAEDELRLRRHRQRLASQLRGVHRQRRHPGRSTFPTRAAARPSATSSRPCADDISSIQVASGLARAGKVKALAVTSRPVRPHAGRADHAEAGVSTADVDLRSGLRSSARRACRRRSRPSLPRRSEGHERSEGARAPRQARHHAGLRGRRLLRTS